MVVIGLTIYLCIVLPLFVVMLYYVWLLIRDSGDLDWLINRFKKG